MVTKKLAIFYQYLTIISHYILKTAHDTDYGRLTEVMSDLGGLHKLHLNHHLVNRHLNLCGHATVSASQQQTLSGRGARVYTCACVPDNIPCTRLPK